MAISAGTRLREARAVAALNHPHICTIHDVGSEAGIDFLVLEVLHGESLASRLRRGPMPLDASITGSNPGGASNGYAHLVSTASTLIDALYLTV